MKFIFWSRDVTLSLLVVVALIAAGCSQPENKGRQARNKPARVAEKPKGHHDHSEWWCAEHGIPEEECSLCLPEAEVKKRFKDKGDWCDKHDRAMSQCFICNPQAKEKYAALYRAKYGKEPPPIAEETEAQAEGSK